jgi:rifampicin phosphotransferase
MTGRCSMKWIFWPDDPATGVDLGGKGLALWKLRDSGLHIPPWFALMPAAWQASVAVAGGIRRGSEEEMSGMSDTSETWPSEAVAAGVAAAVRRLCPEGGLVAVRSSAAEEDGAAASFAGQLESFLGVGAGMFGRGWRRYGVRDFRRRCVRIENVMGWRRRPRRRR